LFSPRQIIQFSAAFSSRLVSDRHSFFWHFSISGSSPFSNA
jgi:hypothetical protein